jgi:hypothetical protein
MAECPIKIVDALWLMIVKQRKGAAPLVLPLFVGQYIQYDYSW